MPALTAAIGWACTRCSIPKACTTLPQASSRTTGRPWTITTGTDLYGDSLFNTRPDGVARNTETAPSYVDLDLRWGHDFAITPNKDEDAPRVGFSAGAFNLLNHQNPIQHRHRGNLADIWRCNGRRPAAPHSAGDAVEF